MRAYAKPAVGIIMKTLQLLVGYREEERCFAEYYEDQATPSILH
jgi:hypothetical protein